MGSWLLGSKMSPRVEQANFALPLVRTNMILPHNLRRKSTLFCSRPTLIRNSTFPATWTKCPRPSNWQTWEEERPKGRRGGEPVRVAQWEVESAEERTRARRGEPTCHHHPPRSGRLLRLPHIRGSIKRRERERSLQGYRDTGSSRTSCQLHFLRQWRGRTVDGRIRATGLPASTFCDGMSDNLGIPNDCG